ncbi:MAG TPA: hypothetical protein PLT27_13575 [Nitrospira sp.]|nr:hypothetical protein [Nitrospira sp.]
MPLPDDGGETFAKAERACHRHPNTGSDDLYRRSLFACTVGAREGLGTDARCLWRENDPHRGLFDGHVPFVAGDVPIELVVILEKFQSVAHAVRQDERAGGIGRAGNPDLKIPVVPLPAAFEFKRCSRFICDGDAIQQEAVIEALRGPIFDGNQALDAVPCAFEAGADRLRDEQVAAGEDLEFDVESAEHERTGCRRQELAEGEEAEQGDDEQARRKPWTSPGAPV